MLAPVPATVHPFLVVDGALQDADCVVHIGRGAARAERSEVVAVAW